MLKLIGLAALLFSTASVAETPREQIQDMMRLQGEFKQCLTDQTVTLGAGNSEGADTLLRAASAVCLPVETQLRARYVEMDLFSPARIEWLIARDRTLGGNAGVTALLAARSTGRQKPER